MKLTHVYGTISQMCAPHCHLIFAPVVNRKGDFASSVDVEKRSKSRPDCAVQSRRCLYAADNARSCGHLRTLHFLLLAEKSHEYADPDNVSGADNQAV